MYKKYRVQTTDSAHDYPVAKNLLNREFTAEKPGQKWVSDMDLPQGVHLGPPIFLPAKAGCT